MTRPVPLVAHVIHSFDIGGTENGLVNLINHLPAHRYRHAVVSLTESTSFRDRIHRKDVEHYSLHKKLGHDLGLYGRLWRVFRRIRPTIVHTRNLATLEAVVPAAITGVPCRVHGEHGWDAFDIDGTKRKYQILRRTLAPFVHRFVALSDDLEQYLLDRVGIPSQKIVRILNGVDTAKFYPCATRRALPAESGMASSNAIVIGTVTRMQEVKDPLTLARAFVELLKHRRGLDTRLVMVGDGPVLPELTEFLRASGAAPSVWLAGRRDDVPELLQALDVFVLSSRAEGISNTVLEAMATGLPVVATGVGGNPELVVNGVTGTLVPAQEPEALAHALASYAEDVDLAKTHGQAGRRRVESTFAIHKMIERYLRLYDDVLAKRGVVMGPAEPKSARQGCAG